MSTLTEKKISQAVSDMAMNALNSLEVGITIFDENGLLVHCNPSFYSMYGLNRTRFHSGLSLQALIQSGLTTAFFANHEEIPEVSNLMQMLKAGQCVTYEWRLSDERHIEVQFDQLPNGGFCAVHHDLTLLRQNEAKIKHLAHYDGLTHLANRFHFYETLQAKLSKPRFDEGLGILRLDVSDFRKINEAFGHDRADQILIEFAKRVQSCCGENDFLARLGGDEFAIIASKNPNVTDILDLTFRILDAIGRPTYIGDTPVNLRSSIGIAMAPTDGRDVVTLMRNADVALLNAKTEVPGAYRFFESTMDVTLNIKRDLEKSIDEALAKGQFELHYQPLIDLKNGKICGAEALIRWNHPENGMISPAAFIPLAEETGQINKIGDWVIERACSDAAQWPDNLMIAVNLSPMQFKSPRLGLHITNVLHRTGLKPSRLELEITESVMLSDTEDTLKVLNAIRNLGVKISMDDFGTGYSSLGYLQKFPFDKIKIDQSFVRDLDTNRNSLAIIRTIAQLGENLGITILAEGIETEAQYQLLRAENCALGQGYFFSRPIRLADFNELIGFEPNHQSLNYRKYG